MTLSEQRRKDWDLKRRGVGGEWLRSGKCFRDFWNKSFQSMIQGGMGKKYRGGLCYWSQVGGRWGVANGCLDRRD